VSDSTKAAENSLMEGVCSKTAEERVRQGSSGGNMNIPYEYAEHVEKEHLNNYCRPWWRQTEGGIAKK